MLQLHQQLGFTNRQLSESHHHCHVNGSEILAALSSGLHESGKKKGTSKNVPASVGDRLDYFKSCMAETRRSGAKKKKERNEWMPAPSGDFSFFPNWGIESRILLSYKPLFLSHHPQRRGLFSATWSPSSDRRNKLGPKEIETGFSLVWINLLMWTKTVRIVSKYQKSGRDLKSSDQYCKAGL